nr:MAG TPA: hypothetical protein [Caudoviricetes sp.]
MLHRYHQSTKLPGYNLCAPCNRNSGDPGGNGPHHQSALHHANPAADLISMVFKICRPKPAEANTPNRERPCLEHVQQPGVQTVQRQHMF